MYPGAVIAPPPPRHSTRVTRRSASIGSMDSRQDAAPGELPQHGLELPAQTADKSSPQEKSRNEPKPQSSKPAPRESVRGMPVSSTSSSTMPAAAPSGLSSRGVDALPRHAQEPSQARSQGHNYPFGANVPAQPCGFSTTMRAQGPSFYENIMQYHAAQTSAAGSTVPPYAYTGFYQPSKY